MRLMERQINVSFRFKTLCLTFLLLVSFLLVLYFTSQKILISSLSKQFLIQADSLTELVKTTLKPHVLSENLEAVNAAAKSILKLDDIDYIQVFSYDAPLTEMQSTAYPQRDFRLDKNLLEARDGFFDVAYLFDIEGTTVGKVRLSFSIAQERALLLEANQKLAIAALGMTLAGLLVTWLLAGRIANRIHLLEKASKRFADGHDDIELPLDGNDEIASTGRAFEQMMWQIREKYEAVNLSPDGILLVSANKRIRYTSPALINMLGKQASGLCGKPLSAFENCLLDRLDSRTHEGIVSLDELLSLPEFQILSPEFKILRCIRKQVESPAGNSYSEVFYLRDITHESEVDRMKSEFLNTAAHELRTPLASVMGFSELLMMNDYDKDKIRSVAETINRQSQNLKALVDDLLDIARIEARSNDVLNLEHGTAQAVVAECCRLMAGDDKDCQLVFESGSCVWPQILFDEHKLKQAVMNILSNAYKYSEESGLVTIDSLFIDDKDDIPWFGIRVTDEGIGMSQDQLAHVGEKFYRADNTGSIPGTGLGMALTREILKLHQGHVEVTSQLGQGTQVTLWLPVAEQIMEEQAHG